MDTGRQHMVNFPVWEIHSAAAKCSARPSSLNNCQANSAAISSEELLYPQPAEET